MGGCQCILVHSHEYYLRNLCIYFGMRFCHVPASRSTTRFFFFLPSSRATVADSWAPWTPARGAVAKKKNPKNIQQVVKMSWSLLHTVTVHPCVSSVKMQQGKRGRKNKKMKCNAQRGLAMFSSNLYQYVPAADLHQRRQCFPAHLEHMSYRVKGGGVQGDLDRTSQKC